MLTMDAKANPGYPTMDCCECGDKNIPYGIALQIDVQPTLHLCLNCVHLAYRQAHNFLAGKLPLVPEPKLDAEAWERWVKA